MDATQNSMFPCHGFERPTKPFDTYMDEHQSTTLLPLETIWEQYFGWQKHKLEANSRNNWRVLLETRAHVQWTTQRVTNAKVSKALRSILPYLSQHSIHSINFQLQLYQAFTPLITFNLEISMQNPWSVLPIKGSNGIKLA